MNELVNQNLQMEMIFHRSEQRYTEINYEVFEYCSD